jgi:hypothetical protein
VLSRHSLAAALQLVQVQAQPEAEHPLLVLLMQVHPVAQLQAPVHAGAAQMARLPEHAPLKAHGRVPSHGTVHDEQVMQPSFRQHLDCDVYQHKQAVQAFSPLADTPWPHAPAA